MGVANEKRDVLLYFWCEHKKGNVNIACGRDNASLCNVISSARGSTAAAATRGMDFLVNCYTLYNKVNSCVFMSSSFLVTNIVFLT